MGAAATSRRATGRRGAPMQAPPTAVSPAHAQCAHWQGIWQTKISVIKQSPKMWCANLMEHIHAGPKKSAGAREMESMPVARVRTSTAFRIKHRARPPYARILTSSTDQGAAVKIAFQAVVVWSVVAVLQSSAGARPAVIDEAGANQMTEAERWRL